MFARFDDNPAMTLRVIKETKRYGRTDGRTDARTDNMKTVYPLQTKFAGGIIKIALKSKSVYYKNEECAMGRGEILTLCMLGNFGTFLSSADFFFKINFFKNYFRNTI